MSDHPYWVYAPDHGTPPVDALAEGRRAFALECAAREGGTDEAVLTRARKFEQFLAGHLVEDVNGART